MRQLAESSHLLAICFFTEVIVFEFRSKHLFMVSRKCSLESSVTHRGVTQPILHETVSAASLSPASKERFGKVFIFDSIE